MEKNKRILNFAEFNKQYSKGDPKSAPGNDTRDVDMIGNAAAEFDEPTMSSGNDIDSVSSKPATTSIKTDYEQAPSMPAGPSMAPSPNSNSKESEDKEDIEDEIEAMPGDSNSIKKKKVKKVKSIKKDSEKSDEDKREESGEY
tara:strand:+ start:10711 stop:11139 length:429 start_codon:yes stop_codon:yes gene_type:complete